jgi:hypothetical protein
MSLNGKVWQHPQRRKAEYLGDAHGGLAARLALAREPVGGGALGHADDSGEAVDGEAELRDGGAEIERLALAAACGAAEIGHQGVPIAVRYRRGRLRCATEQTPGPSPAAF